MSVLHSTAVLHAANIIAFDVSTWLAAVLHPISVLQAAAPAGAVMSGRLAVGIATLSAVLMTLPLLPPGR